MLGPHGIPKQLHTTTRNTYFVHLKWHRTNTSIRQFSTFLSHSNNSSDPKKWKESDVRSWLLWTLQQFSIPMSMLDLDQWNMDGQTMLSLGEQDFQQRLPQGGDTMYAQFDMWRSNAAYHYQPPATCGMAPRYAPPPYPDYGWGPADGSASPHQEAVPAMPPLESTPTNTSSSDTSFSDIAFMLQMLDHQNNPVGDPQTHYITPKVEPSSYPPHQVVKFDQNLSSVDLMILTLQASPPPYPGSEMLSQSPSQASPDFGVDPMEEDEGEYSCATNSDKLDCDV